MPKLNSRTAITTVDDADELHVVDVSDTSSDPTGTSKRVTKNNFIKASEIKTKYESNADTNTFTDAEKTKLSAIEANAKDDQNASEVPNTPSGDIVATDVQAAINELDSEKVAKNTLTSKGDLFVRDASSIIREAIGADATFLQADSSKSSGITWASPITPFDATVGPSGASYTSLKSAIDAGKRNIVLVGPTTETADISLIQSVKVSFSPSGFLNMDNFRFIYNSSGVDFNINGGSIQYAHTSGVELFDSNSQGNSRLTLGGMFINNISTIDNCPLIDSGISISTSGLNIIQIPNQSNCGLGVVSPESNIGTLLFQGQPATGGNIDNILTLSGGDVGLLIFLQNMSTTNPLMSMTADQSIGSILVGTTGAANLEIRGTVRSVRSFLGNPINIKAIANESLFDNVNLSGGVLDFDNKTNLKVSNFIGNIDMTDVASSNNKLTNATVKNGVAAVIAGNDNVFSSVTFENDYNDTGGRNSFINVKRSVSSQPVVEGNIVTFVDSSTLSPFNLTSRSTPPSSPNIEDVYLDNGTNTSSGGPGFRKWSGTEWEDLGALASSDNKDSCRLASTQKLADNPDISSGLTYNNTGGGSGRGQITATLGISDQFTVDSIVLSSTDNGDRILIKNEGDVGGLGADANGIYTITISGTSLTLDRATDFDADVEVTRGASTLIAQGSINQGTGHILITDDPIIIGGASGSNLTFTQFSGAGGGETNTASNVGTAGVGVFKQKNGVDLEFKNINAGSSKVTITDDVANDELDIDVDEAQFTDLINKDGSIAMTGSFDEKKGSDVASSATINLETATGNIVDVTGTTAITGVTLNEGHRRLVRFTDTLTLTNGPSLVLPGGVNITTALGDYAEFVGDASGVVRVSSYIKTDGRSIVVDRLTGDLNLNDKVLRDANGNEALEIGKTASAVNHPKVSNAASGNDVVWEAVGDDLDISNQIKAKGSGKTLLDGVDPLEAVIQIELGQIGGSQLSIGDGQGFFPVPSSLQNYNLTTIRAHLSTVSTSGSSTFAIRRLRGGSPVDMLSTNITVLESAHADDETAVIDTANDDVVTDDLIFVDIDTIGDSVVHGPVTLTFARA